MDLLYRIDATRWFSPEIPTLIVQDFLQKPYK